MAREVVKEIENKDGSYIARITKGKSWLQKLAFLKDSENYYLELHNVSNGEFRKWKVGESYTLYGEGVPLKYDSLFYLNLDKEGVHLRVLDVLMDPDNGQKQEIENSRTLRLPKSSFPY